MNIMCNFIYDFYEQLSAQNKIVFFIILFCVAILIVLIILSLISSKRKESARKKSITEEFSDEIYEEDNDISRIAKQIEKDLEENSNIDLTDYENDQENTSIISYQELIAAARKTTNEVTQKAIETEEDLGKTRVFKPSEFISPVYGTQNKKERQVVKEPNSSSEQFLKALKRFRSNLDE